MKLFVVISVIFNLSWASEDDFFPELLTSNSCQVIINTDLGNPQPLFIRPGTNQFFHPSDRRGIIEMSMNEQMELFCTNGFATPGGIEENLIQISCLSGVRFQFNGIFYNLNEFSCRNWPTSVAQRRVTITRCFNQGTIIDVGFQVENRFFRVFSSCHNPVFEENYYTQYQLTPASDGQESNVIRPGWRQSDFFPGKNVDTLHTRVTQRETIATILGSSTAAARIVEEPNSNIFLARGHLAAMTDFISANEQRSTFFFVNTAPQFQTFNSANWVSVEISSRRLAADRNIVLDVYTGTFGRATFKDVFGIHRDIFLDYPSHQIPVPALYYKILVNQADRSGIVLLGVNNPHLTLSEIQKDFVICNDISDRINYVSWRREDLERGYGYACDVNEFLRKVPHIPGVVVKNLLV
jgi:DNA/RNA non-specific endonuclease